MGFTLVSPCDCGQYQDCLSVRAIRTNTKDFARDLAAFKLTHDAEDVAKLRVIRRGKIYTIEDFVARNLQPKPRIKPFVNNFRK